MTEDRKIAFENIRLVLLKYAKRLDFREMIKLLNDTGSHFCIPPTDYDRFEKVTPYSREVSLRYKTNYVNASFVDRFITCQNPKEDHFETFYSFISKSEISLIIALEYNISYLNDYEILIENKIFRVDLIDLRGRKIKRVVCKVWKDLNIMEYDDLMIFYNYLIQHDELKQNYKTLIHCQAGVGRTGTFIFFILLSEMMSKGSQITPDLFIHIIIRLRMQRNFLVETVGQMGFLYSYFTD